MENGFIYLIKASSLIGLFYFAYFLLLRKETFFSANRWFLLLGLVTSSILPLFFITKIIWVEPTTNSFDWSNIPVTTSVVAPQPEIDWYLILTYAYFIGIAISLLKLVFDFNSLIQLLKGKTIQQQGNFKFIDLAENIAPFSYFNYIVYNSSLYSTTELENILEHEKVHSLQKHSIDVLISRLFCVIFWFNPLVWLYKKAIAQNLEFIADSEAAKKITDKKAYQFTLLKITTQENCVALTNHFYQSLIKKRIIMLNQNQSKKSNSWKYATVFPALVAFVFLFQIEVVAQEKEIPKQKPQDKINTKTGKLRLTIDPGKNAAKDDIFNRKIEFRDELIVVNGIPTFRDPRDLYIDRISSIKQLNIEQAIAKYGTLGKKGAFEITTENNISPFSQENKLMETDKKNEKPSKKNNKSKNKKTARITTKSKEPIKSYLKEYYIDGKKSTAFVYSKLDINNIDKVETNPYKKKVIVITKKENSINLNQITEKEKKNYGTIDSIESRKIFQNALVIIDGKKKDYESIYKIKDKNIKFTHAFIYEGSPDESKKIALATYGEKARNGVLVVETSPLEKK